MDSPSPLKQPDERVQSDDIIAGLPSTDRARQIMKAYAGAVAESETVTQSDAFGYIYRYDILHFSEDPDGNYGEIRSKLILWTQDGETFQLATHSLFELAC